MHENISSEKIKKTLHDFAQQNHVPCISSATEQYLIQHLMEYKPTYCLEIGSAMGYSTLTITNTIHQRKGELVSFEISHPSYMTALYHLQQTRCFNTTLYHGDILSIPLSKIIVEKSLDFVFIDGAKDEYADYLIKVLPYCTHNATIICDDVIKFHEKIVPLYDIIKDNKLLYEIIQLEEDDGILVIKR